MGVIRSGTLTALLIMAIASCRGAPAKAPGRTVSLRIDGGPPEASVTIDDEMVGSFAVVARHGVALPRGAHRLTVEATGFLPFDRMIEASSASDTPILVHIVLMPVPD